MRVCGECRFRIGLSKNPQRGASRFRQREGFLHEWVRAICCTSPQRAETTESGSLVTQQPSSCGAARLGEYGMVRPFQPMAGASLSRLKRVDEIDFIS